MVNLKEIVREIEELFNMKYLVGAYEEIASMRMRKIRSSVLTSRDFVMELAAIYQEVTTSYRNQIINILKEKNMKSQKNLSVRRHNGKTACVFLSANSGLFGDILQRTYRQFLAYIDKTGADPVIIGTFGKKLFEGQFPDRKFIYLVLVEDQKKAESLRSITEALVEYDNIIIYYALFQSMSSQTVAALDVYGLQTKLATAQPGTLSVEYIFEPSLERILEFFESQIFSTILDQTFTESELARYAARMVALDAATKNIDDKLKDVDLEKRLASHRLANKKQVESLSSMSLWG